MPRASSTHSHTADEKWAVAFGKVAAALTYGLVRKIGGKGNMVGSDAHRWLGLNEDDDDGGGGGGGGCGLL